MKILCRFGLHKWKEKFRNFQRHYRKYAVISEADIYEVCERCGKERFIEHRKWYEPVEYCIRCGKILSVGSNIITLCKKCLEVIEWR